MKLDLYNYRKQNTDETPLTPHLFLIDHHKIPLNSLGVYIYIFFLHVFLIKIYQDSFQVIMLREVKKKCKVSKYNTENRRIFLLFFLFIYLFIFRQVT